MFKRIAANDRKVPPSGPSLPRLNLSGYTITQLKEPPRRVVHIAAMREKSLSVFEFLKEAEVRDKI